uniref:lysosomal protective protein-like n=1 Tax=Myxine glutinosa TaxID=7769 RepID=UPI0035902784
MLSRVSSLWMRLQKACCLEDKCNFYNSTRIKCSFVVKEADNIVENIGLNIYNLYSPCDGGVPKSIRSEGKQLILPHPGHLFSQHKFQQTWRKVVDVKDPVFPFNSRRHEYLALEEPSFGIPI